MIISEVLYNITQTALVKYRFIVSATKTDPLKMF